MTELLNEYDDTFNTEGIVDSVRVQGVNEHGKLCKMPQELLNYRRPCQLFIKGVSTKETP